MIDLEMDTDVTKSSQYASQMKASLTDIPSISLVTDVENGYFDLNLMSIKL